MEAQAAAVTIKAPPHTAAPLEIRFPFTEEEEIQTALSAAVKETLIASEAPLDPMLDPVSVKVAPPVAIPLQLRPLATLNREGSSKLKMEVSDPSDIRAPTEA